MIQRNTTAVHTVRSYARIENKDQLYRKAVRNKKNSLLNTKVAGSGSEWQTVIYSDYVCL